MCDTCIKNRIDSGCSSIYTNISSDIKLTSSFISQGTKKGEKLNYEPTYIICRNKKEVEMAKRLVKNELTAEEWCSYSRGAEQALNEIWNGKDIEVDSFYRDKPYGKSVLDL